MDVNTWQHVGNIFHFLKETRAQAYNEPGGIL